MAEWDAVVGGINGEYRCPFSLARPLAVTINRLGCAGTTLTDKDNFELCPNPWTTLFVAENGGVHLCFLSEPVGNIYETPLVEIWNSPKAIAKRLRMIQGNYMASGCSSHWCSWREGKPAIPLPADRAGRFRHEAVAATSEMISPFSILGQDPVPSGLTAVRRALAEKTRRLAEMEQVVRTMDEEFQRMRQSTLVRAAAVGHARSR